MSFVIAASSFRVKRSRRGPLRETVRYGLFAGLALAMFALVGAYVAMSKRVIVESGLTLAHVVCFALALAVGFAAAQANRADPTDRGRRAIPHGTLAGLVAGLVLASVLLVIGNVNLRGTLVNASPLLVRSLGFGLPLAEAAALLVAIAAGIGLFGGALALAPKVVRTSILYGLTITAGIGLFRDLIATIVNSVPFASGLVDLVFGADGLHPWAAGIVCVAIIVVEWLLRAARSASDRSARFARHRRNGGAAVLVLLVIAFPLIAGNFIAQVVMMSGLYMLMAMGLNIELGLAGLVDLGFVAFFAVGAYTVALLCAAASPSGVHVSFWVALLVAIVAAATAGLLFGLPVLRVRGDYLAMATLGLGEIVRVLVVSDAMAPWLGGPQGIIEIARPEIFGYVLNTPVSLYYLTLVLTGFVGLVSWRLQHSRTGRAWMAIREDEEVAQALSIDLVANKLLAYTVGAAFAGAAGAVFAVLIGAVFPSSFELLVSLNVLAILVVGGLGSLPGVVVGTFALIGLPELFRELGEFRYLFYGLALVGMMHWRAEGLWPAARPGAATSGR